MTDLIPDSDPLDRLEPTLDTPAPESPETLLKWLDAAPPANVRDELALLLGYLDALRASPVTHHQRSMVLARIYGRSITVIDHLRPTLADITLPLQRRTRPLIRGAQNLLRALADDLLATPNIIDGHLIRGLREMQATLLWRALYALSQHVLISNLIAAPAGAGIWTLLHKTYATARNLKVAHIAPENSSSTPQDIYYSAVLLGCAQPASFTSKEIAFVAAYLEQFSDRIELSAEAPASAQATFWIDPTRDVAAFACSRKAPPADTHVCYFSCAKVAALLRKQLAALEAGSTPKHINLPELANTTAGRGALRRLIAYWGDPGKRRFARRRQNFRAVLCAGLDCLWRLYQSDDETSIETSSWMITNESPDGYAVMHISGKTGRMAVGDVTAIRTETGKDWQICIIRWALSENQEHLEFGLQILATNAVPAFLAQPGEHDEASRLSVLILPEIPALRSSEMLVVPAGALENRDKNLILVFEKENIEVREVKSTHLDEQNSRIEVFSITPNTH